MDLGVDIGNVIIQDHTRIAAGIHSLLTTRLLGSITEPKSSMAASLPLIWRMDNKMETAIVYWDYIGIMQNNMETTIVYWGFMGIIPRMQHWVLIRLQDSPF